MSDYRAVRDLHEAERLVELLKRSQPGRTCEHGRLERKCDLCELIALEKKVAEACSFLTRRADDEDQKGNNNAAELLRSVVKMLE